MTSTDMEKIDNLLTRGVENIYPNREAFEERLKTGKKIRLYLGVDPTAPQLHIGHAIGLRKLREFQDLGHEVILLIGSFTAMIGDPTDKMAARVQLTQKEVLKNAADYKKQASKILRFSGSNAAKIMFNHKWLAKMSFEDVIDLASHFTVQQMAERDMFERRIKDGKPVYLHEFLYPLMQGYDSVAMDVDAEVGGSDQTFNMLAGRTLMKSMQQKEKFVLTTKLLTNDEGKKMSKTEGGLINLNDAPEEMYGKLMAMNDSMIMPYFEIATNVSLEDVEGIKIQLTNGVNPRDLKARLAATVVAMYYDEAAAIKAGENFEAIFQQGAMPDKMPEHRVAEEASIVDVLVFVGLASSKSEARRQIEQGAVKVDGVRVDSIDTKIQGSVEGLILQKGKRHFVRLVK
ncbi:MAG: tyrosine--tRNA ligase [Patescibacteria group bacterium]